MSWSAGAVAPMTTILSRKRDVARGDVGEVLVRDVTGRSQVVDPRARAGELTGRQRPSQPPHRGDRERVEAVDPLGDAAQDAAPVLR
jgi:hypothetical protein